MHGPKNSRRARSTQTPDGSLPNTSEWTLNLAGVPPVNKAGLVIYLMDVCNWKDDAVDHYQQSNGYRLFDKGHLHNVKNTQILCQLYLRGREMYHADTVSGLGTSGQ